MLLSKRQYISITMSKFTAILERSSFTYLIFCFVLDIPILWQFGKYNSITEGPLGNLSRRSWRRSQLYLYQNICADEANRGRRRILGWLWGVWVSNAQLLNSIKAMRELLTKILFAWFSTKAKNNKSIGVTSWSWVQIKALFEWCCLMSEC